MHFFVNRVPELDEGESHELRELLKDDIWFYEEAAMEYHRRISILRSSACFPRHFRSSRRLVAMLIACRPCATPAIPTVSRSGFYKSALACQWM